MVLASKKLSICFNSCRNGGWRKWLEFIKQGIESNKEEHIRKNQ